METLDLTSEFRQLERSTLIAPALVVTDESGATFSAADCGDSASPNLLAGVQSIRDMMNSPEEIMQLEFNAKINLSGLQPTIRVREKSDFNTTESRGSVFPE